MSRRTPTVGGDADAGDRSPLTGPTAQTLAVFAVVFLVSQPLAVVFRGLFVALFTLQTPVTLQPWTLVTSVYAHAGLLHLLVNSAVLVLFGLVFERMVRTWAYHAFFVGTGALAGVANVWAAGLLGGDVAVLGASGAIFGVVGYVLAGNRLSLSVVDRLDLSVEAQAAVALLLAGVATLLTASPGVALVAHFVGLLTGLAAGRVRLLPER